MANVLQGAHPGTLRGGGLQNPRTRCCGKSVAYQLLLACQIGWARLDCLVPSPAQGKTCWVFERSLSNSQPPARCRAQLRNQIHLFWGSLIPEGLCWLAHWSLTDSSLGQLATLAEDKLAAFLILQSSWELVLVYSAWHACSPRGGDPRTTRDTAVCVQVVLHMLVCKTCPITMFTVVADEQGEVAWLLKCLSPLFICYQVFEDLILSPAICDSWTIHYSSQVPSFLPCSIGVANFPDICCSVRRRWTYLEVSLTPSPWLLLCLYRCSLFTSSPGSLSLCLCAFMCAHICLWKAEDSFGWSSTVLSTLFWRNPCLGKQQGEGIHLSQPPQCWDDKCLPHHHCLL
jgi:hypothetical protein